MRTNVYVDGFNLYYGAIKDTPYRWLDLDKLCREMLPKEQINRIRYFTAPVKSTASDPTKRQRQEVFLRALQTIPNLSIHEGHFLRNPEERDLVAPLADGTTRVWVWDTQEKGSDVNLAMHLFCDGVDKDYECAVLITNDSDQVGPIEMARQRFGARVGVINPHSKPSNELYRVADFHLQLWASVLKKCQFPNTLRDANGLIHKPSSW